MHCASRTAHNFTGDQRMHTKKMAAFLYGLARKRNKSLFSFKQVPGPIIFSLFLSQAITFFLLNENKQTSIVFRILLSPYFLWSHEM